MPITRGFTYTVVDRTGRPCYHVPESRAEIEFELAHLGRSHRLLVDVPDNDGDEVSHTVIDITPRDLVTLDAGGPGRAWGYDEVPVQFH